MRYNLTTEKYGINIKILDNFIFRDHYNFFDILDRVKKDKPETIVLDLSECTFMDSSALGMLVLIYDEIFNRTKTLPYILNANGVVYKTLKSSKFDELYTFIKSIDQLK